MAVGFEQTESRIFRRRRDQGYTPETCERRTTDGCCLFLFLASITTLVHICLYSSGHGHPSQYLGLSDYEGRTCGHSESVAGEPFLYMCKDPSDDTLDLKHPICIAKCPKDGSSRSICPLQGAVAQEVPDYPTEPFANRVCLPTSVHHKDVYATQITSQPGMKFFLLVAHISQSACAIAVAVVVALLLGVGHIFFLKHFSLNTFWVGLNLLSSGLLFIGLRLITASYQGSTGGKKGTGDTDTAFFAGIATCVVAVGVLCMAGCEKDDLELAKDVMKAATECIIDSRSLLLQPFVALTVQCGVFLLFLQGLLLLLSCGEWRGNELVLHSPIPWLLLAYLLVSAWVMETCVALSHFVVAYVAEEWYFSSYNAILFTKDLDLLMAGRGYFAGLRYHLGSLACGSLQIALVRGPRKLMTLVDRASSANNGIGRCIQQVCGCCLASFKKKLECLNRTAYMEVALNALPFDWAAHHAMEVLSDEATDALMLHGATSLVELVSSCEVTAAAVAFTHLILTWLPAFSDPSSRYHVEDPYLFDITSAAICFPVAMYFSLIVGHVSDCLVFCCAVDRARHPLLSTAEDVESSIFNRLCLSRRTNAFRPEEPLHLPHTRRLLESMSKRCEHGTEERPLCTFRSS